MSATSDQVEVYLDCMFSGPLQRLGMLHWRSVRGQSSVDFEYDSAWLQSGNVFQLDPDLSLYPGRQYPNASAMQFGVFLDSAPDRWGRLLMDRREVQLASAQQRPARVLTEWQYLLGVQDFTRLGALRFKHADSAQYMASDDRPVPPITRLRELQQAAWVLDGTHPEQDTAFANHLALLLAPGSSLGGARPKGGFADTDGSLWLAKFPARNDRYDVAAWEYLTHGLAKQAGIVVPEARLLELGGRQRSYGVKRFDRTEQGQRRHFLSAMALLGQHDGQNDASYLDLAQALQDHGDPEFLAEDLTQLFRRVLFNRLVGNRDDHLRNHGFLRTAQGWRLAPAFDVNPEPGKKGHVLALDAHDPNASIDSICATAEYYRCAASVNAILQEVRTAVGSWRQMAQALDLPKLEIALMAQAFESPETG